MEKNVSNKIKHEREDDFYVGELAEDFDVKKPFEKKDDSQPETAEPELSQIEKAAYEMFNKIGYSEGDFSSATFYALGAKFASREAEKEILEYRLLVEKLLQACNDLKGDLYYQISSKHGNEKAFAYPSIVNAAKVITRAENKMKHGSK